MRRRGLLAGCCVLLLVPAHARGEDAAGRRIAAENCQPCHGIDGVALIPEAPHIAGQNRNYMVKRLMAFRDGERVDEKMTMSAAVLSDEEIADVADWYSSIRVTVAPVD